MKFSLTFLLILLGSAFSSPVSESDTTERAQLLPYGYEVGDQTTPVEDDGFSGPLLLSKDFVFFGKKYKHLWVNNNGPVSMNGSQEAYDPEGMPVLDHCFATTLWADVDIRECGQVFWRETDDPKVLAQISHYINDWYKPEHPCIPVLAFIATWDKVCYFGTENKELVNTFQLALVTGENDCSFTMMLYKNVTWTTGAASGGDPETGLGGMPATAGLNSGNDIDYVKLPDSGTPGIVNIDKTSNVDHQGAWIFQVNKPNLDVKGVSEEFLQKMREEDAARKAEREAQEAAEEAAKQKEKEEREAKEAEEAAKQKEKEEREAKEAEEAAKQKEKEEREAKEAEEAAKQKEKEEKEAKEAAEKAAKQKEEEEREAARKAAEAEAARKEAEAAAVRKAEEDAAAAKKEPEEPAKEPEEEPPMKVEEPEADKKPDNPKAEEEEDWEYYEEDYEDCEEEEEEEEEKKGEEQEEEEKEEEKKKKGWMEGLLDGWKDIFG